MNGEPDLTELQNARKSKIKNTTLVQGENDEVFSFRNGKDHFLIIPYKMALNSSKIGDHLIISDGLILNNGKQMSLITRSANSYMHIYPAIDRNPYVSFASLSKIKPTFKGASSFQLTFKKRTLL